MQEAVNATLAAIETRLRLYRCAVITVASVVLACAVMAAWLRSWRPLAGFILLVPAVGTFFVLDSRVLRRWRRVVLQAWVARQFELRVFAEVIRTHPTIPEQTLRAMLASLPVGHSEAVEWRYACVRRLDAVDRRNQIRTTAATAALTVVLICVAAALWQHSTTPLLVAVFPSAVWMAMRCR